MPNVLRPRHTDQPVAQISLHGRDIVTIWRSKSSVTQDAGVKIIGWDKTDPQTSWVGRVPPDPLVVAPLSAGRLSTRCLASAGVYDCVLQHGAADVIVQRVHIWRVWKSPFFSINLKPEQFACSPSCVTSDVKRRSRLKLYRFVNFNFRYICQQKLAVTCIFYRLTLNSRVKISFKTLRTHRWNINKSRRSYVLLTAYSPCIIITNAPFVWNNTNQNRRF